VPTNEAPTPSPGLTYHLVVTPPTQRQVIQQCENLTSTSWTDATPSGERWVFPRTYTHLLSPGKASCFGGNVGSLFSPLTSTGRHTGGVNLLLGDGGVRFFANGVETEVWQSIGSRDGGEPTGDMF
jgi:prepilin-type processing-associated H-X9-DG protein